MIMNIIDFHAHILPCADHGSDSKDTSQMQLALAREAGVDIIVATPHFYPHRHNVSEFINRRANALNELGSDTIPRIVSAAEVLLCEGIERLPDLEKLTVEGTKSLLIELPFSDFRDSYFKSIEALLDKGYDIIIAHADRYPEKNIETLLELKVKLQLNADAFSGFFIKKHIKDWIEKGAVYALGSDIHKADKKAYKNFLKARAKLKSSFEVINTKANKILSK